MAEQPRTRHRPPRRRRKRRRSIPMPIFALSGVVALLVVVTGALSCMRATSGQQDSQPEGGGQAQGSEQAEAAPQAGKVTFCAVGDNLINEAGDYTADLLGLADAWAGESGDGTYDFSPLYAPLAKTISSYDIALINQETVLGGTSEFEYQGYPSYNTPDEMAQAVAQAGFDVVNCNTNHTYDMGSAAIEHAQKTWAKQKDVAVIGSYASEQDRANIRVVERNGIKIAFLSYSYGQNGYEQSDLPNDYYAAPFDKDKMKQEVAAAKEIADAVVVYMHWGDENTFELSDEQRNYASFLAGLGVDLVVGSHAHVIQPVKYVSRGIQSTDDEVSSTSSADSMLCVYGLGDFVSGYTLPKTILSGMFTCEFVRDEAGVVSIANPAWHGLVEHNEGSEDAVYLLSEYTQEQAESNRLLARVGENDDYDTSDPLAWAKQTTRDVVGNDIAVEV